MVPYPDINYIIPIREISLANKNKTLYDFDIFDEKYFVIYSGERDIEVYIIKNEIEIEFKMKLPLYREFQSYKFDILLSPFFGGIIYNPIARSYHNKFLSILLMEDNEEDGTISSFVFIYSLEGSQHNSYVMDLNVTDIF